jgi:subtilase family serine protease
VRKLIGVAGAGLLISLTVSAAEAAPASVRLAGSAAPFASTLRATGTVPGGQRLTIEVWLAARNPAGAARYAMAVSTPGSWLFHHFLRPGIYTARFGGTSAEAAAVTSWLRGVGFTTIAVGGQRSYVKAAAPVSLIDAAFGITLRYYRSTAQVNAGPYRLRANDRRVRIPGALAPSVLAITGLDNEAPSLPVARAQPVSSAKIRCSRYFGQRRVSRLPQKFGAASFGTSICGYTASQLRKAYGANRASDGRGQTVALVVLGLARHMFNTLQDYARFSRLPAPSQARYAELNLGRRSCPDLFNVEEQLDVEAAYAMAPGVRELVVGGNSCNSDTVQALDDALMRILVGTGDRPLASIASNSWEDQFPPTTAQERLTHTILLRAAAEGVGMYFAAGDAPGVRSPSDDPFATAVGGTSLGIGRSGDRLFETGWSSGQSYIRQHRWTRPDVFGGGGGGPSPHWAEPSYQKGVVPQALSRHGASRSVPDLSAAADPVTGMTATVLGTARMPQSRPTRLLVDGTSLATPLVAGLVADAQQGHVRFGFLNPVFYRLAATRAFHDILPMTRRARTRYRAIVCVSTSRNCITIGPPPILNIFDEQARGLPGYTGQVTLKGYDNTTGLGTPDGQAFIAALRRLDS